MSEDNQEVQKTIEEEAREQNWVPKEEFRGDPNEWVDAETFVRRGKEINPILRENNKRLMKEVDKTKKELKELREATEEFKKFKTEQLERKTKEFETQIKALREEKKKAISAGDGDLVVELDDQIDALKDEHEEATKEPEKKAEASVSPPDPAVVQWIADNSWYRTDKGMIAVTNELAEEIHQEFPDLTGKEFLDELDKVLERTFNPEKLGRKKKQNRSPVEGAKPSESRATGKKTYDNLPPEAKAACDKFVRQKILTVEQYLADYEWTE